MNKTKIDWATASWNPVTGCLHECQYCYARGIAHRFAPKDALYCDDCAQPGNGLHEIRRRNSNGGPWKYDFAPTLHSYRLCEPQCKKNPQNIFVCSMADLFGAWVPDSWIKAVFDACAAASWHNYIFLTKNPERYTKLVEIGIIPDVDNIWLGSTATTEDAMFWWSDWHNTLVSIEPIHGPFDRVDNPVKKADWVIIGAESGSRKGKVVPERKWIENILVNCRETGTPVFMKDSLSGIWGEPLVQEFPAALQRNIA